MKHLLHVAKLKAQYMLNEVGYIFVFWVTCEILSWKGSRSLSYLLMSSCYKFVT